MFTGNIFQRFWQSLKYSVGNLPSSLANLFNKWTGNDLTDAEKATNQFNAEQAEINRQFNAEEAQKQRDFEERMSSTSYQRAVTDMRAAGVNPALAIGQGGAPTPSGVAASGSAASAGSPSSGGLSLSDLLSLFTLGPQVAAIKAGAAASRAAAAKSSASAELDLANAAKARQDTARSAADTKRLELDNQFFEETWDERKKAIHLANNLTNAQERKVYKEMDGIEASITKALQEAETEQSKRGLMAAQKMLAAANARQVVELLPYQQSLMSAQTEAQRNSALLAMAQASYQNGLIDAGMIDAAVRDAAAGASEKEQRAVAAELTNALKTGNLAQMVNDPQNAIERWAADAVDSMLSALSALSTAVGSGLAGVLR